MYIHERAQNDEECYKNVDKYQRTTKFLNKPERLYEEMKSWGVRSKAGGIYFLLTAANTAQSFFGNTKIGSDDMLREPLQEFRILLD